MSSDRTECGVRVGDETGPKRNAKGDRFGPVSFYPKASAKRPSE